MTIRNIKLIDTDKRKGIDTKQIIKTKKKTTTIGQRQSEKKEKSTMRQQRQTAMAATNTQTEKQCDEREKGGMNEGSQGKGGV